MLIQNSFYNSVIQSLFNSIISTVGKKFALNIFYNLAIILSIFGLVWCYNNHKYLPAGFLVGTTACLFYFKYQLTKDIRKSFKEKDQK
jgi:hypothetical protein